MNIKKEQSKPKIIDLTPDHVQAYKAIRLQCLKEAPQAFGSSYSREIAFSQEQWIERVSSPYGALAMQAGQPIGTMSAYITEESGKTTATIVAVFVAKEARGQGLGRQLLNKVIAKLRKIHGDTLNIQLTVNTEQTAAVRLYQKFGFEITAEETVLLGDGKHHQEYVMKLA